MRFVGAAVVGLALLAACTPDDPGPTRVDEAEALTAIVRWAAADALPPDAAEGDRPVVYVVSHDGSVIASGVQAEVARTTVDDIDVRFADDVEQATLTDEPLAPVRDGGVLLLIGPMPEPARRIEVAVDVYVDATRTDPMRLTVTASDDGATVTAAEPPATG